MDPQQLEQAVKEKYGEAARAARSGQAACSTSCCSSSDPITSGLYTDGEAAAVPKEAMSASLGCGNPTALVDLRAGDVVLDLGSGGGIDVLLSATRVGETGTVYGLDMTGDMLALARENQRKAGATNVEFLEGSIDAIPLPDASVDVVISNCVINLAADKDRVLREAFRVLRPGGRFAVSDVVVMGRVPEDIRRSMELWVGCIAGALEATEYVSKLETAGFAEIGVEPWRVYNPEDAREFLANAGLSETAMHDAAGKFASAFVRARKPVA